jgi:hypothetical protein
MRFWHYTSHVTYFLIFAKMGRTDKIAKALLRRRNGANRASNLVYFL